MKNKILPIMVLFVLISFRGFSQDTMHQLAPKKTTIHKSSQPGLKKETTYTYPNKIHKTPAKKPMYRDTRLGSSTKKYDTYKKNDKGAGAVTTSPK
jgi:hypothetical protein